MASPFLILPEREVRSLCESIDGAAVVEAAYREFGREPDLASQPPVMTIANPPSPAGARSQVAFRAKGAVLPSADVAGVLLFSLNRSHLYLWSTPEHAPTALVASDWLSKRRVALTVIVAIRRLARREFGPIAFFGAGPWARPAIELTARQWPDSEILVVTRRPETATAYALQLPANVTAADASAALRRADVVVTLTTTQEPFIHGGLLKPGSLLLSMGSAHEATIDVLHESAALIVDDLAYAQFQGDIRAWLSRGEVTQAQLLDRLRGSIGEVCAGTRPGRLDDDERIFAVVQGLTACDVALAQAVVNQAIATGTGMRVEV